MEKKKRVEMKTKRQKTLDGKLTWHGICTRNCWFAKGKRCRCRCKGVGHGKGLKKKEVKTKNGIQPKKFSSERNTTSL